MNVKNNSLLNKEIIKIFSELLEKIYAHLESLIGKDSVTIIFKSTIKEVRQKYPLIAEIKVIENKIETKELDLITNEIDPVFLKTSFFAIVDNLLSLCADLTGPILVSKIEPMIIEFKKQLNEGNKW